MTLADVAQQLEGAQQVKDGYRARCPVHQGKSQTSLHIWEEDGGIRVHCFGGCEIRDIRARLGLNSAPFQNIPVEQKPSQQIADEMYADLAEQKSLAEILTPKLAPAGIERLLGLKKPPGHDWVAPEVAERLAAFAEPGYRQYRVVVDEFFHKARYSRSAVEEIRKSVVSVLRAKEGTIASRSMPVTHYLKNPPPKKAYQHEKVLALSGVTVLAGRPKMGKSYLALNLALAIAGGGVFASQFEISTPGDVLYLALEDDASRMWSRVQALAVQVDSLPSRLYFDYAAPTLDDGQLVTELEEWVAKKEIKEPRLIVIDVLRYIQGDGRSKSGTLYDTEYADMALLNKFAHAHDLQILLVTHLNKNYAAAEDVVDTVMNSTAITGGAGGIWVLRNQSDEIADAALRITGKDIPTWDCALKRIDLAGHLDWKALGEIDEVIRSDFEHVVLLGLYTWSGHNPTQTELRETVKPEMDKSNFYRDLKRMEGKGLLLINRKGILLTTLGAKHAEILAKNEREPHRPAEKFPEEIEGQFSDGEPWQDQTDDDF